jgi:NAD(P)-dependent dehydrogenase (short-subunit alcohol dehydrogenase family)
MNQTALITGGSRGIGLGIAREMAAAGFDLVINGVREMEQVDPVLDELRSTGKEVFYVRGDIADGTGRKHIYDLVMERFGRLNVLINNAGIAPSERRDILDATEESYDKVMGTNLKGSYFLTQLFAGHMVEVKKKDPLWKPCIINISSTSATVASTNRGEYCISKAGISMATRLWAARLGEFSIPVYEIRPGIIKTDMTAAVSEKYDRLIESGICIQKRWGSPADVGKVAAAMATGAMPYSTGQVVVVDGGMSIPRL